MIDVLGLSPFERPDPRLVRSLVRAHRGAILDLGRDARAASRALADLHDLAFAVRVPDGVDPSGLTLPAGVHTVVVCDLDLLGAFEGRTVVAEVRSVDEAQQAIAAGADIVLGVGHEAAGRVGQGSSFVLAQRLAAAELSVPFWIRGGIGPHTAAACAVAGAAAVVVDSALALVREADLPAALRRAVRGFDGADTRVIGGHRVYVRPDLPSAGLDAGDDVRDRLGPDLHHDVVVMGQDAALAAPLADAWHTAPALLGAIADGVAEHLAAARDADPLGPEAPLAASMGTAFPIVQGPMTRVSDVAPFADAVARGGGLPFVALSLLRGPQARELLTTTAELLGDKPWGVGILGFAPPELRQVQLDAILAVKPPQCLIAGGRPSQARELEQAGIATWLHAPSPALTRAFLTEGARRFVFEGRECGGHVGPRSSFVLWEQQLEVLLAHERPEELEILFAGGIHDARSAAMVAALSGPLAAKGAKIGVLMGTAYLFTEEAVASGAILPSFQQAAIATRDTALLETAPGHATRCAPTPFVDLFAAEKARLKADGVDSKQAWQQLEQLNVGRLRVASKGIERQGSELVPVDDARREAEGMVMIGEAAALHDEVTTIAALHADVASGRELVAALAPSPEALDDEATPCDIAIVGMSCIFPDAPDLDTFWRHTLEGHDAVREIPDERWRADLYFDAEGVPGETTPSKWGGLLPTVRFDPMRFGIPPRSLASIDPAQLLALQVAADALVDAGYDTRPFDRSRASVIFGTESGSDLGAAYSFRAHYRQFVGELSPALDEALPRLSEDSFPGVLANVLAGRIANRLDLGGVNYTVDAACASSLAALDLAVKELVGGTSDVVLCGGADLHNGINDYLLFSSTHALSRNGHCSTFDANADGIVLGEGVACVVLKRLADARRDGDRVYAVVKGVGGSSDGKSLGLTAPRKEGQQRAVRRAWAHAGLDPADAGLVEAHGTGTVVGDRTELRTLTGTFGAAPGRITLGSVKSQIGHTKCAAGLAGLIKAALSVHHGVRPPTSQLTQPNPAWDPATSPFHFADAPRPWPARDRIAAVSAFGFGGTNFHTVLQAADPRVERPAVQSAELFLLRGDDAAVDRAIAQLATRLDDPEPPALAALAKAVSTRPGPVAVALVASSHAELRDLLAPARARTAVEGKVFPADPVQGELAWLFAGQGAQKPGMLRDLFVAFPELQRHLAVAPDLADLIHPPQAFDDATRKAQADALTDTRVTQPALGMVSLAVADWLDDLGVRPAMAAGHSYGEVAALTWAGAIDAADLVAVSRARAEAILAAGGDDPGTMAAVMASADLVADALEGLDVVIANHNTPRQSVISGTTAGMAQAVARLEAADIPVKRFPVACAFHSPVVAAGAEAFRAHLADVPVRAPRIPVFRNETATPHASEPDAIRDALGSQIAAPVRFVELIEAMYAAGARTFVEVGPSRVLTGLVRRILRDRPFRIVSFEEPGAPGLARLLGGLAQLAAAGVHLDADALFAGRELPDVDLAKAPKIPLTTWLVDGHRARPERGELPPGALKPILEPLGTGMMAPAASGDEREQTVVAFLNNMQDLANAQRDAMMAFLGQAPPAPVARPTARARAQPAAPTPQVAPAPAAPAPKADLLTTLLDVVSERTGYPAEMLDADADLEADLSVDSIKRIEILHALGDRLGLEGDAMGDEAIEQLAARRTLSEMVAWLEEQGVEDGPGDEAPQADAVDVRAALLEVVSERTGYPAEMLDPAADLEADLSIDSIKRIEILHALGERLGLDAGAMDDDAIEQLAARRTLDEMVAWLEQRDAPEAPATPAPAVADAPAGPPVQRFLVRPTPADDAVTERPKRVAVVDANATRGAAVAARLRDAGIEADVTDADHAEGDAIVHLDGAGPVAVFPELASMLERGAPAVVGVDAGGTGLEGLYRTAAREYPDRTVRLVSVGDADPDRIATLLTDELSRARGPSHVRWEGDARQTLVCELAPLDGEGGSLPLSRDSVVLLTGGGRGITAQIAKAMAAEVPCTYVLVGRSPLPGREPGDLLGAVDALALRRALIARGGLKPAEIEREVRRVLKERELRATIRDLEGLGATVDYRSLDVRDGDAVKALVKQLTAEHGRVDGVVHGAGVLDDKLMRDKTPEAFARVYETKVNGARALAEALPDDVSFVVFFGSISGVLGNRGQADYASANATLDTLAGTLQQRIAGRVVSIDWGPWGGAGMVSPELAAAYQRRGIPLIPLQEGLHAFLDELRRGSREHTQVVWQAGRPEDFTGEAGA